MTAIVGIVCEGGIVIGTDSSATFTAGQLRTIEQETEKLTIVGDGVIVAGTGSIGLDQRFVAIVQRFWSEKKFKGTAVEVGKQLSRTAIEDMGFTGVQPGNYGALVAFPCNKVRSLCEFASTNFQPELKTERLWYVSLGSSQHITDSFLALMRDIYWQSGPPSVHGGVFAATWALDHAVAINPGGVNGPIRIAVLETVKGELKARILEDSELAQHREYIGESKKTLREHQRRLEDPESDTPDPPKP